MSEVTVVITVYKRMYKKMLCKLTINVSHEKNNMDKKTLLAVSDINVFFGKQEARGDNDDKNKKREKILEMILHMDKGFFEDKVYGEKWVLVREKFSAWLDVTFKGKSENAGKTYDEIKIIPKGGRSFNYDFQVVYKKDGINVDSIEKLEFKNGKSIESLPQIMQISTENKQFNPLPKCETYAIYYYTNHLAEHVSLLQDNNVVVPPLSEYLKEVPLVKSKKPFFVKMHDMDVDQEYKSKKNNIVNASITQYLEHNAKNMNIDGDAVRTKLTNTQLDKTFLLWDGENFKQHVFTEEDFDLTGEISVRKGNTIVFPTKKGSAIEFLLRWKNHGGVLNPAWQISYHATSR